MSGQRQEEVAWERNNNEEAKEDADGRERSRSRQRGWLSSGGAWNEGHQCPPLGPQAIWELEPLSRPPP